VAWEGKFIAFAGIGGNIVSVKDGEVIVKGGESQQKRRVTQLAARQAHAYSGLQNDANARLIVAVFLLAECVDLDTAEKALAQADGPGVEFYKDRLATLMSGAAEVAAKRAWDRMNPYALKAQLSRNERLALAKLVRDFDEKHGKTKFADSVKEKLAALRARLVPVYDQWPFDEAEARRRQKETAELLGCPVEKSVDLGGGVKLDLALVPAGKFIMGNSENEVRRFERDDRQHTVWITRPFYIGKHEVTQEQWSRLLRDNPSFFRGARNPVEQVSWDGCQQFINKLNALGAGRFRLPTEAEWEFACRAGTSTAFHFGDQITLDQANLHAMTIRRLREGDGAEFQGKTAPVGSFPANAFGLCDMHGNILEWCADWYGPYPEKAESDPKGPADGTLRVIRGGAWSLPAPFARSASRARLRPADRVFRTSGFRVAATCPGLQEPPQRAPEPPPPAGEDGEPRRQKHSARPDVPELEWRPGSDAVKGMNGGATVWAVRLPFLAGQVREESGVWVIASEDSSKEAAVSPAEGKLIRMVERHEPRPGPPENEWGF